MGHANVYIRKDDEDAWEAIENKSEWLHNALINYTTGISPAKQAILDKVIQAEFEKAKPFKQTPKPYDQFKEVETVLNKANIPVERLSNGLCKIHGTPLDDRGKCLQKGCKYA